MKELTGKQLLRNTLEMAIAYNNSVEAINELLVRKEAAIAKVQELQVTISQRGGKRNCPDIAEEFNELRAFIDSFDAHASVTIDGREPQNKGLRQFMVLG